MQSYHPAPRPQTTRTRRSPWQSPLTPPHHKLTPIGKPAALPVLVTATNQVRQMPAKFPAMTTARKRAAKMVSWQCPTKSRQRIISYAAAVRSTTPSG